MKQFVANGKDLSFFFFELYSFFPHSPSTLTLSSTLPITQEIGFFYFISGFMCVSLRVFLKKKKGEKGRKEREFNTHSR